MAFEKMCRGWALGSREFKKELLKSEGLLKDGDFEALRMEGRDLVEVNKLLWEELLERGFRAAGQTEARARARTNAPNAWIAQRLHMGVPHAVTIHVRAFESEQNKQSEAHEKFIERFTKCPQQIFSKW